MRALLDTHIAVWLITGDPQLDDATVVSIRGQATELIVSAAAIWEISIKYALRRGTARDMRFGGSHALSQFLDAGFSLLAVEPAHAAAVDLLPPHHGDPFDRLMIAQAIVENLQLVTRDSLLGAYGEAVVLV